MGESTPEEMVRVLAKRELRKRLRGIRKTTPATRIEERSAALRAHLLALPAVRAARSVASFWPIVERHEVDLRPLHAALREMDKQVAYPRLGEEPGSMELRFVDDPATLAERGHGFAEPADEAPLAQAIDVVIVPALALDPWGRRLGYGAGYYDRLLPRFCPPGLSVGVCFSFQILGEVPVAPHDTSVALVLSDEGLVTPETLRPTSEAPGFARRDPGVVVVRRP